MPENTKLVSQFLEGLVHNIKEKNYLIMKQITINIPDNKYLFFIELIKNLGLEKVNEKPVGVTEKALKDLEQSLREVKLIQEGKMKGTPLNEFLDEL